MKISISNIAWSSDSDNKMYKFLYENNICGLEIAPTRIIEEKPYDKLDHAKNIFDLIKNKYHLEIISMQSILFGRTENLFGSKEERKTLVEYNKKAIDFASVINCKNLVFGSPKNRIISNKEQYSIAVDFFSELGSYAVKKNTTISIEANPVIYGTNFINTTEQAVSLVNDVKNEGFRINLDLGTIIQNGENMNHVINNIDLINHIHISEPKLDLIKRRQKHKDLACKLKELNYDKYVSIEMKLQENIDDVKKTIIYIKEIFNDN